MKKFLKKHADLIQSRIDYHEKEIIPAYSDDLEKVKIIKTFNNFLNGLHKNCLKALEEDSKEFNKI